MDEHTIALSRSLVEASRVLASSLDPDEVLRRLMASTRALPGSDVVSLWLVDEEHGDLALHSQTGGRCAGVDRHRRLPMHVGLTGEVVRSGRPLAVSLPATDPRAANADWFLAEGLASYLGVPLRIDDECLGVLACMSRTAREWSDGETAFAETLGTLAAVAIRNARIFGESEARRQAETALARDNAELYGKAQRAYDELAAAQAQLVRGETLRAMGELASGVAHHLNNLLAVVLGRLQLARAKEPPPPLARHIELAERAALDGAEVVRRMRSFSRGHPPTDLVPVDLNRVVHDVAEMTRGRWHDEAQVRGIRVDVQIDAGEIPPVRGEAASLREVLMNLVMNAIDALPGGGTITIRTWTQHGTVHCEVADDGTGMPPEVLERAMEPFFTTKGYQSTGLGLSVSYGAIQRHGGTLTIDSEPARGTRVAFQLPAVSGSATATERPAVPSVAPLRILVVDDEASVRSVVAEILGSEGHHVAQAASGPAGLAYLDAGERVDLVLTDLGMPGMTGWEVARGVKVRRPGVRVGLLTGWGERPVAKPEERVAADFVLAKPVTVEALRAAVASAHPARS
jgi:signal transduction histidine kinase